MPVVIDASAIISLALTDEDDTLAKSCLEKIGEDGGLVPRLFWYEVANVLYVNEPKGRITATLADEFLDDLMMLPLDDNQPQDLHEVLGLARKHRITPYDAAYLEIALRNRASLATLDKGLQAAARSAGVALLSDGPH